MNRASLPNRRSHEAFHFFHWSQKFIAGIGRATPTAPIAEVWINTGKTGTQAETLARDSAVLLSLALQYGVPLSVIGRKLMRDADGTPSGPMGQLVDIISRDQGDSEAEESEPRVPNRPVPGSPALEPVG